MKGPKEMREIEDVLSHRAEIALLRERIAELEAVKDEAVWVCIESEGCGEGLIEAIPRLRDAIKALHEEG